MSEAKEPIKLPSGRRIGDLLKEKFNGQKKQILKSLRRGSLPASFVPLADWDESIARESMPLIQFHFDSGVRRLIARVGASEDVFSVVSPKIKEAVEAASLKFARSTNETTSMELSDALKKLRQELTDGLVQGEPLTLLRDRVNAIFERATQERASMIAETEASRALHHGRIIAAKESGVVVRKKWLLSSDACEVCHAIATRFPDGIDLDASFGDTGYGPILGPPAHPRCLLGETPVFVAGTKSALVTNYCGPILRIVLSTGDRFACTPNHMLLTPAGFAFASSLMNGDDVIYCPLKQGIGSSDPYDDRQPIPIQEVVAALAESGGVSLSRVPVASEYLHGDGRFCNGQVDVIRPDCLLRDRGNSFFGQEILNNDLNWRDAEASLFPRNRYLDSLLKGLLAATGGAVGILRELHAVSLAHFQHAKRMGFAEGTSLDASIEQDSFNYRAADATRQRDALLSLASHVSLNNLRRVGNPELLKPTRRPYVGNPLSLEPTFNRVPTDAETLGESTHRLASHVTTCKVTSVRADHFSGPVFDLETESSMYIIGSGIVSSNCMCTMEDVLSPEFQESQ